ncbi:hypothetical protein SHELI_v1c02330 [Spiroplasma helicoides]|uniref:Uncharacterized protein n=1 Tax=Spiroplasma helicoides TaxID=216938 RepID=A0A1B3SJU3_9MOLU|nr:hypothetical protein [Spiroplasma helicoides]AOG60188.1 hypothetical protein SHELI_v1c02330 [Spiroplasma helicoides]
MLLASWTSGHLDQTNMLLIAVVQLVIVFIPVAYGVLLVFNYKKSPGKKLVNKLNFSILWVLPIISLILSSVGLVIYFGENIFDDPDQANTYAWTLIGICFALIAVWYALSIYMQPHVWASFEEEQILFYGGSIKRLKVKKFIVDKSVNKIYINFIEGRSSLKKYSYQLGTLMGEFILKNASELNYQVEEGNEKDYLIEENKKIKLEVQENIIKRTEAKKTVEAESKKVSDNAEKPVNKKTETENNKEDK